MWSRFASLLFLVGLSLASNDNGDYEELREIMKQILIQSAANNCPEQHGQLKSMLERGEIEVDGSYQGDIVLTVPQAKAVLEELRERGNSPALEGRSFRVRRQLVTNPVHLWNASEPIPYRFEFTDESPWDGCKGSIGRNPNGRTQINLDDGCWDSVIHEVMHTLGINHEHDREDRDSYVTIEFGNIQDPKLCSAFNIAPDTTNLSLPYDFSSVMHYGNTAFSKGSEFTIKAKDDRCQYTMGQRLGPSFKDIALINKQYCDDVCKERINCGQNGGYQDPNNCTTCKCPTGSYGVGCSMPIWNPPECAKEGEHNLMATEQLKTLKSPERKTKDTWCFWNIWSPHGRNLTLNITVATPQGPYNPDVCTSYIEVKERRRYKTVEGKIAAGPRFCRPGSYAFTTATRDVQLLYRVAVGAPDNYPGFVLTYVERRVVQVSGRFIDAEFRQAKRN